ncbi:MAG TPA: class I SAM-dependent methyltransferase [Nitrospirae bacterium]|nr:class I SAM-dependent methyltransferase [Nitrospirota bacterium]
MTNANQPCKICNSFALTILAHTAICNNCGVLLCYPYPEGDDELFVNGIGRVGTKNNEQIRNQTLNWHLKSGTLNHQNFTRMTLFALSDTDRYKELKVLDYGGGGGQFALVLKSLFPLSKVQITDISDVKLLDQFRPLNHQIKFANFKKDETKFDIIFMNDVFEHVSDPLEVLKTLSNKLADQDSRIFIDTPRQFWIYPITRLFSKKLHIKLLRATVDYDHQQIWSRFSFTHIVGEANLSIVKYLETSQFTQPGDFYLNNMKITNPLMRLIGKIFYRFAPLIARNKIMAVLKPVPPQP